MHVFLHFLAFHKHLPGFPPQSPGNSIFRCKHGISHLLCCFIVAPRPASFLYFLDFHFVAVHLAMSGRQCQRHMRTFEFGRPPFMVLHESNLLRLIVSLFLLQSQLLFINYCCFATGSILPIAIPQYADAHAAVGLFVYSEPDSV